VQGLGSGPLEIETVHDLDFEPAALTWKRPQTTTPKTDSINYEVFLDILHNSTDSDQPYQTLTLSATGPALKVRLVSMTPNLEADGNKVTCLWREYRTTSASSESYETRFGLT
jgi:hypothetical protein